MLLQHLPVHENEHAGKLYLALRDLSPAVELPKDLRRRAEAPLLRMLEQSQS